MAVIKELDRRGTLKNALAGRDEEGLSRLLTFVIGYATPIRVQNMFNSKLLKKISPQTFYSSPSQEFD